MFSASDNDSAFTLYKMFPREAIKLEGTLKAHGIEGVLTVTYDDNSPDPCGYLHVNEIMSTQPKVRLTFKVQICTIFEHHNNIIIITIFVINNIIPKPLLTPFLLYMYVCIMKPTSCNVIVTLNL